MILLLAACGTKDPHDHDHHHDHELITSVVLDMTDQDGNEYSFAWDETTGDAIPDVEIPANSSLTVAVSGSTSTTISVRRFCCRPSGVSLVARGRVSACPTAERRGPGRP